MFDNVLLLGCLVYKHTDVKIDLIFTEPPPIMKTKQSKKNNKLKKKSSFSSSSSSTTELEEKSDHDGSDGSDRGGSDATERTLSLEAATEIATIMGGILESNGTIVIICNKMSQVGLWRALFEDIDMVVEDNPLVVVLEPRAANSKRKPPPNVGYLTNVAMYGLLVHRTTSFFKGYLKPYASELAFTNELASNCNCYINYKYEQAGALLQMNGQYVNQSQLSRTFLSNLIERFSGTNSSVCDVFAGTAGKTSHMELAMRMHSTVTCT